MQSSLVLLLAVVLIQGIDGFSPSLNGRRSYQGMIHPSSSGRLLFVDDAVFHHRRRLRRDHVVVRESSNGDQDSKLPPSSPSTAKKSLEEKMMGWEATKEEIEAATLGGVVPRRSGGEGEEAERSDAFDIGLYIAFPIIVATGLLFAFFPLLMGNIDTSSVGPPPTI